MITVFGSLNTDLVVAVPALPKTGETVKGPDYQVFAGGKGGNQALASRRAGADVAMIGAVGHDEFANIATATLVSDGVDISGVQTVDGPTGLAFIAVDAAGRNQIVVASGANARADADTLPDRLGPSATLILQMELPGAEIEKAIHHGRRAEAFVLLNVAPFQPLPREKYAAVDVLILNEGEARALAASLDRDNEPELFCAEMSSDFGIYTVVTRGGEGAVAHDGAALFQVASPKLGAIDTTGAGDAFVGAFAAAIDADREFPRALAEGVAAGSLACTVTGAQPSIPPRTTISSLADELVVSRSARIANDR